MRKFISALLALILIVTLPSCKKKEPPEEEGGTQTDIAFSMSDFLGEPFIYEKDGIGGEGDIFHITFYRDCSFIYSEGAKSEHTSERRLCCWAFHDGILSLSEKTSDERSRVNLFTVTADGYLHYISDGSDGFSYITPENGDRFKLTPRAREMGEVGGIFDFAGKAFFSELGGFGLYPVEFYIYLSPDKSFSYYEGFFSSHISDPKKCNWSYADGILTLTEDVSVVTNGNKSAVITKTNKFKVMKNALIYMAEDSDGFFYIKPKDGEFFILSENKK